MLRKTQEGTYLDFGAEIDERDYTIFYTAARSMLEKSGCLLLEKMPEEPEKVLTDMSQQGFDYYVEHYPKL